MTARGKLTPNIPCHTQALSQHTDDMLVRVHITKHASSRTIHYHRYITHRYLVSTPTLS